ncbi:MAG: outer-membrane lipoprotein carrier protein LolA, partial [Burkholderiales bacterium]
DDGARNGLEWLQALPNTQDSTFESVRMGFNQSGLEVMELRDHFGQTTVLHFLNLQRNPRLNPELFKFTPPKGADIVGE